jgi:sialidase-1
VLLVYCVEYQRVFVIGSDDDGATWTAPVEITAALEPLRARINWQALATGPGHGIETAAGRIVVPLWLADYRSAAGKLAKGAATLTSDDGGVTWEAGALAIPGGNEAAVVETAAHGILLTARNSFPPNRRIAARSPDGAGDWTEPLFIDELPEWGCAAGLVRHPGTARHPGPLLLHSAPDTTDRAHRSRRDLSLWVSRDDGATWPIKRLLRAGPAAYSDLAVLPDGSVVCVMETGLPGVGPQEGRDRAWAYAAVGFLRLDLDDLLTPATGR